MSRKTNDAPLKLIQLVPSNGNEEASGLSSSDESDQGLRLQIGIEGEPSWGSRALHALTRSVTRHSHRMSVRQETKGEGGRAIHKPGFVTASFPKLLEALRVVSHRVGAVIVGGKQKLVSLWGRFHQADDDLDNLMQTRLDRTRPQELDVTGPLQKTAPTLDRNDDALAKEIQVLREEFNAQQYELSRVNSFVVDLKSRVIAQQKMILSLAEELDAMGMDVPGDVSGVSKESGAVQRH